MIVLHSLITVILGWFIIPLFDGSLLHKKGHGLRLTNKRNLPYRIFTSLAFSLSTSLMLYMVTEYSLHALLAIVSIMLCAYAITSFLLYFTAADMEKMEVPRTHLLLFTSFLLLLNLILVFPGGIDSMYMLWAGNLFVPVQNLVSGTLLAGSIGLIIIFTKGKGMGRADIAFAAALGMLNGYSGSILGTYIAIFSALIYGVLVAARKKKIKNTRIPFIPFLVLGTITAFLLPDDTILTILQFLRQ